MELPGKAESCWVANAPGTNYPRLDTSFRVDVAVIGAGIVGLTAAFLLRSAGYEVTVLEARKVGRQVTGRSTAKVTAQHALVYADLVAKLGVERARLYAEANHVGVETIAGLVRDLAIDCDFARTDAYAYTLHRERLSALEDEAEAARALGFDADVLATAPLPFETAGALRFRHQGQFDPARYLVGLAAAFVENGGRIFEDTRVGNVEKRNSRWRIDVDRHRVHAEHVIVATNLPIFGPVHFDQRTRPRCHTAMAFRAVPDGRLDGVFIDVAQPSHSLRMARDREGELLIVLGPSFTTGSDGDIASRFRKQEAWVRDNVPAGEVVWRWVNEDYDTPDRVPFAGELPRNARRMYVAGGFNGWGISNGTAAAILIADQVQEHANPWRRLYNPTRPAPKNFNAGGESQSFVDTLDEIAPGAGGVIERGDEKLAVWKDDEGNVHALSASCTHMGCTVTWNNADETWDCPCHGSMFTKQGEVIHGPATKPLEPHQLTKEA